MKLKRLVLAGAVASVFAISAPAAKADVIQLGFILDRSGSIGFTDYGIITTGLAQAIASYIPIGGTNTYEISIVTFAAASNTLVNTLIVDDIGDKTTISNALAADAAAYATGGTTNYTAGFTGMRNVINASANYAPEVRQYINFATDGVPNPTSADGIAVRNQMIADGYDNISIEGIGITSTAADFLRNSICYPGPCDSTAPYNFPTQGFYIGVANATEYASAIQNKIQTVVGTVPEPGTLALLGGLSLAGLAAGRRRTK